MDYSLKASTKAGTIFNFLSGLGDVAFAYAGHNVVLEIQANIPSTPEKPSKKPMMLGCTVAYLIVALCYFPVAIIGYYVFGNSVEDNIMLSLQKPTWLIVLANAFVIVHVIGSYQVLFAFLISWNITSYQVIDFSLTWTNAGFCNACVRHAWNSVGEAAAVYTWSSSSFNCTLSLCWWVTSQIYNLSIWIISSISVVHV